MSNFYYFFIEKYNTEIVVYFNLLKEKDDRPHLDKRATKHVCKPYTYKKKCG